MFEKLFYIWEAMGLFLFLFNAKSLFCCKQRCSLMLFFEIKIHSFLLHLYSWIFILFAHLLKFIFVLIPGFGWVVEFLETWTLFMRCQTLNIADSISPVSHVSTHHKSNTVSRGEDRSRANKRQYYGNTPTPTSEQWRINYNLLPAGISKEYQTAAESKQPLH